MVVMGSWLSIFVGGMFAAAAFLLLLLKLGNIRKMLMFDVIWDVIITASLMWALSGTFVGMMIALTAGVFVSATLFIMKQVMGYDLLTLKGWVHKKGPWE